MSDAFSVTQFGRLSAATAARWRGCAPKISQHPIKSLVARHEVVDWDAIDDVIYAALSRPAKTTATLPGRPLR